MFDGIKKKTRCQVSANNLLQLKRQLIHTEAALQQAHLSTVMQKLLRFDMQS